ncbi:hypothetical protein [Flexithrix dorotheae]|uniref:hypothetical protein n=1 Tax=Flexithrix dorotheae TaxID=70993 RepID=UPI00037AF919|nr:hypothetical protein [Flexithrix dorotheae]
MYSQLTSEAISTEKKKDKQLLGVHIGGRISKDLHDDLLEFCDNEDRTISDAIRLALKEFLYQNKPNP